MKSIFPIVLMLFLVAKTNAQNFRMKLTEHVFNVETVSFSPDGKYLASGSTDGVINLYTIDSSQNPVFSKALTGHLGTITILNFSKNGKYLVSASKDYSTRIWNLDTPANNRVFNLHLEPVSAAFLDPSYKYLITASEDATIKLTNLNNPKASKKIKMDQAILDLTVSIDRKYFYVVLANRTIKKIESAGRNIEISTFAGAADNINSIDIAPSNGILACGSNDKTITLWDANSCKVLKKLEGFEWKVTCIKFSSDSKYIIGSCNNGEILLFDVETGKIISSFKEIGKNARSVSWNKDGSQIAVASYQEGEIFGAIIYNTGVLTSPAPKGGAAKPETQKAKPAKKQTIK